jgi:hypothetical protein
VHASSNIDALCYAFDAVSLAAIDSTYSCAGMPASNVPHDNSTSSTSNSDASIERRPGGTAGNCTDTGNNNADFVSMMPATPLDAASAPTH